MGRRETEGESLNKGHYSNKLETFKQVVNNYCLPM